MSSQLSFKCLKLENKEGVPHLRFSLRPLSIHSFFIYLFTFVTKNKGVDVGEERSPLAQGSDTEGELSVFFAHLRLW